MAPVLEREGVLAMKEVTGFRLGERELGLLDEASVSRSELVRFLIVYGLGGHDDLGLVADVMEDLAENHPDFSEDQRRQLFSSVSLLRAHAERDRDQVMLTQELSKG